MSEYLSDPAINRIADGSAQSTNYESETQQPALSEVSPQDKPWDKHRAFADRVQTLYAGTEFDSYSTRINFCSQLLEFGLQPDEDSLKLKLRNARFCRVPRCPICQWRRSLRWKAKAYQVLPTLIEKYPTYRWLFMTLTVKNVSVDCLRDELKAMNKAFKRMTQRKVWPAVGWLRSTEVTRGRDGNAHPHFHCLLMVQPSFFSHGYIKRHEWVNIWRTCMKLDYTPVIDVRAVKQGDKPMQLVPEIIKYVTKESDMVADREWFLELTRQLHKMRLIATGGVLKEYLKELQQEPEDLIGEGDDSVIEDLMTLLFGWRRQERKYRLKD